jgi:hypothetical protein
VFKKTKIETINSIRKQLGFPPIEPVERNQMVTVTNTETGRDTRGKLVEYTPDRIILEVKRYVVFDAKRAKFKDGY